MTPIEDTIRLVILGDTLVSSSGDTKGIGWLGRVMARTPIEDPRIESYALAAPDQTSAMVAERWQNEALKRFSENTVNKLAIMMPNSDPASGISISRSRLNLANILDEARKNNIDCFVIGPTPHRNPELNSEIEHLVAGFEDVCARRQVAFVDCFTPLVEHEGWNSEVRNGRSGLPGQVGHGLLAWLVLNRGWHQWLGVGEQS